ncbi:MAG: sigma-70 family RNA polymerase sigma factor [Bacteroidales bacterium]|nr:sigma-70 family RNA polymerase sigma factor [Bacteroidales bacterium]
MNQERFKAEILPIREKLFHIAQKILVEEQEAEDAVQEVLLKLWHTRDSLDNYDNAAAFATTVTKNHCLDRLRVKNRLDSLDDSYNTRAETDNPYLQLERKNTEELLHKIINSLPPLQQAIIRMKDMEEYEVEKIAEITGTKVEAVRMNLSRARKKVREEYIKWTRS